MYIFLVCEIRCVYVRFCYLGRNLWRLLLGVMHVTALGKMYMCEMGFFVSKPIRALDHRYMYDDDVDGDDGDGGDSDDDAERGME